MGTEATPQRRRRLRRAVESLFKSSKGPLYYSTICEKTGGDLEDVVAVCNALIRDGKIRIHHPSRQRRAMKRGGKR